jgi:hypothetical protein
MGEQGMDCISRIVVFGFALMAAPVVGASGSYLCPDGTYVSRGPCRLCPDGSYVSASSACVLAPDGSYHPKGARPPQLTPEGDYVSGRGKTTLCPDGSYVSGSRCILTPDGTYVGSED